MNLKSGLSILAALALASCSKDVKVTVSNESDIDRTQATVELSADSVLNRIGSSFCYVTDENGKEIPSQLTYDGKLIFQADIPAGATLSFKVCPADTLHSYPALTAGRLYPERADDLAWENEVNGYRAYGPSTQNKGERALGYDVFFKHKTDSLILEKLYGPETSPATWQKADSLRKIDPALAEDFINSISYHIDHGLGMDCYAVGPTLGDGVAAILVNDSICFQWCYKDAQVLDNGPLRFTARLDFSPIQAGNDTLLTEHRIISLDAGSYLNRAKVWYEGQTSPLSIAMGFPLRDDFQPAVGETYVAYSDPTQGDDNGRALLGLINPNGFERNATISNHILGVSLLQPSDTLDYYWGFAWDREDIKDIENWTKYLGSFQTAISQPLVIKY